MTTMTHRCLLPLLAALALAAPGAGAAGDKPACTYAQVASFPLRYSGPALEITVDGEIDGAPARMLVDTGSFSIFLTQTGVERRALPVRYANAYVEGVGGTAKLAHARVRDLAVGPVHSGKVTMDVITRTAYIPSYDAIIGAPFLLQADLEISLSDKMLKMYSAAGCGDTFLALWAEGSIDVPFLPGYKKGSIPRFTVKVNGHELKAIIDSGAGASVVELDAARRAGLKLDGPGVTATGATWGVGERKVRLWRAVFDSLAIGTETIGKPELAIMDSEGRADVDVILGADFLRTHRVLFAMSQGKLYLAYLGGEVFSRHKDIEPWMQREADTGNADAQYLLGKAYLDGEDTVRDTAKGVALLEEAAAHGSPYADLLLGRRLMHEGRYAQAEQRLKAATDKLPTERLGALLLYLARLHTGDPAFARRELEATFERSEGDWPTPIADFYLGRIDAGELLSKAGRKEHLSRARGCEANSYIASWHEAHGDKLKAEAFAKAAQSQCAVPSGTPDA